MNNNSQRIEWIDLAKTFMIMVVIFCHVPQYDTIEKAFFYSFQMPFFFFVSGFLHKRVDILSERFHKYWKTLLIPYFIFQIIYYPYYLVQNVLQDGRDIHNILDWGIEPLIETIIGLPLNGPTWFIFSLFIMKAIIDLGHKEKNQFVYLLLFLCTSFIISYLFIMKDDSIKISFCIDGTAKYMPYFILGQIFKLKFSKQMRNTSNRYILLSLSILFTIATILALEMIRCGTINSNYILYYCIAAATLVFCNRLLQKAYHTARRRLPLLIYGTGLLLVCFVTGLRAAATDADHYELRTAEALRRCDYAAAYRTGEIALAVTPRLFAMRSYLLATQGEGLSQTLFKQPIPAGGSKYLLLPNDEWQRLNFSPDSLYVRLGGTPAQGETTLQFLQRLALPADTAHRPTPLARDYYLCALLLDRRLSDFAETYAALCPGDSVQIPRFYSEALALHSRKHDLPFAYNDAAVEANLLDFMDMARKTGTAQEGRNLLRRSYGETFWWYYYFGQKGTGQTN